MAILIFELIFVGADVGVIKNDVFKTRGETPREYTSGPISIIVSKSDTRLKMANMIFSGACALNISF